MIRQPRPDWWHWRMDVSRHVALRMLTRLFTEPDLRAMLQDAHALVPDVAPGRWLVRTHWDGVPWEVIVEPDYKSEALVVVTAYKVQSS